MLRPYQEFLNLDSNSQKGCAVFLSVWDDHSMDKQKHYFIGGITFQNLPEVNPLAFELFSLSLPPT